MLVSGLNWSKQLNFQGAISDISINGFRTATQRVSDCYLMASIDALSRTQNGCEVLKNQIQYDDEDSNLINCYFYANGQKERYQVPAMTVVPEYEKLYRLQDNSIIRALDISVSEYEKKHKSKPWICRIGELFKTYKFEYNSSSHFLETLTNVKPYSIGERGLNFNLKKYKKEVMSLLERMEKEKDFSFILGTGISFKKNYKSWHCFVIESVDLKNNEIIVKEKRTNIPKKLTIDEALSTFKYVVGYFNSDLNPNGANV